MAINTAFCVGQVVWLSSKIFGLADSAQNSQQRGRSHRAHEKDCRSGGNVETQSMKSETGHFEKAKQLVGNRDDR